MVFTPKISGPGDSHDFHDSSLIDFSIGSHLDSVEIVVSTPDEKSIERLWLIKCEGVLRLEYETLGDGGGLSHLPPLEIYDIYNDETSTEKKRWAARLKKLGVKASEAEKVHHIVLASSFARGWADREYLEGINIICRRVSVKPAPSKYSGQEYSRPRIEGASDE
jgi:hypothetical protein